LGSKPKSYSRTADPINASGQEIHSLKKETGNAARTVAITGRDRGASPSDRKHAGFEHFASQPKPRGQHRLNNQAVCGFWWREGGNKG